ncbi:diguanylate cyclase [Candidatus Woesearchaeota archaeon]|nr:MAG: diguanylate cyclase [Candidatus Woesearchaeota archaeon]
MHLDLVAWKNLQEHFSSALNLAIDFLDIHGRPLVSTGTRTPYSQLLRSQKMGSDLIAQCIQEHIEEVRITKQPLLYTGFGSLQRLIIPIICNTHEIGVLTCEFAQKLDRTQLKDLAFLTGGDQQELTSAFYDSQHPISIDEVQRSLHILASLAPTYAAEKKELTSELSKLTLIKDFTQAIRGILDLTQLTNTIERFLEPVIKSSSTTLITYKDEQITNVYHSEVQYPKHLLNVDVALAKIAAQTKTGEYIKDTSKDIRLKEFFEKPRCILSIPLIQQKNILGCVIIHGDYIKELTEDDFEVLSLMSEYLSVAVSNALSLKEVERLSITDPLTGLHNRRSFNQLLEQEIARSKRTQEPLSLLLLDIDHFKNYNDTNGHQAGDKLLKELAQLIKTTMRKTDIPARYGGEEFVIILPNTSLIGSEQVAEKLRQAVEEHDFDHAHKQPLGHVSISIGLATLRPADTQETLIKRADDYLYKAKERGRNQFISSKRIEESVN